MELRIGRLGWAPAPVVSAGGTVFYLEGTSGLYDLYAVDANTGAQIWQAPIAFDLGFSNTNLVTVDEEKELVYFVEKPFSPNDGRLLALDLHTGAGSGSRGRPPMICCSAPITRCWPPDDCMSPQSAEDSSWIYSVSSVESTGQTIARTYPAAGGDERREISRMAVCGNTLLTVFVDRADSAESVGTVVAYDVPSGGVLWQKAYDEKVERAGLQPGR